MANVYSRAGASLALILSTATTAVMIPQAAEARRAPQWECVDYVEGDYVGKGYTYVVGQGYCVDVTPPPPPPPPPPPDPCDGEPAPNLTVGPTSLSLYVGETRTVTTSISNGSFQGAVSGTGKGTVSWNSPTVSYTGTSPGSDSVTITATNACYAAQKSVSVTVLSTAPTAGPVNVPSATFNGDTSIPLALGGPNTYASLALNPSHGSVAISGSTAVYTPAENYFGTDSFTYVGVNANGTSAQATVSITIPKPGAPTVSATSFSVTYGQPTTINLPVAGAWTSINAATLPAHGTLSLAGNVATYTPTAGYIGADSFTFFAIGAGGNSATAQASITVKAPAAPIAGAINATTEFGTPITVEIPNTGGGYDGISLATPPDAGSVTLGGTKITYTPNQGFTGYDIFTYRITGPGGSSTANMSVTVKAAAKPIGAPVSVETPFETAKSIALSATGIVDSFAIGTSPAHGTVSVTGSTATYTPAAGYYGADLFTFTATGPGGASAPATVSVEVARPAAPSVSAVSITAAYDTAKAFDLSASGVFDSLAIDTQPQHGTVSLSGSKATYTPAQGYFGSDAFTFTATGPGGLSAPASVNVTVERPAAPTVTGASVTTGFEASKAIQLSAAGVFDGLVIDTAPAHGTVTLSGSTATYTPAAGYYGADAFTFAARGPGGISAPATVSLTVDLPPAPIASDTAATTPYLTAKSVVLTPLGVVSKIEVSQPAHGQVELLGATATYTPADGFWGDDSFGYTVTGPGGVASAVVRLKVDLPPAPVAKSAAFATSYGQSVSGQLRATGIFTDFEIRATPAHGDVSVSASEMTYTPNPTFYGRDSFTYVAHGPGGVSEEQTVSVEVGLPGAPTAKPMSVMVAYDGVATAKLLGEGVFSAIDLASTPAHGVANLAGDVLTYTPAQGFFGDDQVTFTVTGPGGTSAPVPVTFEVAKPPAPVASSAEGQTGFGVATTINLAVSGVFDSIEVVQAAAHGAVTIAGKVATYTPANGYFGGDTFTYVVKGPGGISAPAQVRVEVGLPPAPTVEETGVSTAYESATSIKLSAAGISTGFVVVAQPSHGEVRIAGNLLTYSPGEGFYGADVLTYAAEGPGGRSVAKTITVSVGLPGSPAMNGGSLTVDHDGSVTVALQAVGVADSFTLITSPLHGSASILGDVLTYTPEKGYEGGDNLRVQAVGPGGKSEPAQFAITVKAAPIVTPPSPPVISVPAPVLQVDAEASGVTQIVPQGEVDDILIVEKPRNGTVEVVRFAAMSGPAMLLLASAPETVAVTYTPNKGFQGRDSFKIAAKGPGGLSEAVKVEVNVGVVTPVVLPEALPDEAETILGRGVRIDAGSNDKNVKSVRVVTSPAHGAVTIDGTAFLYTPNPAFIGDDVFSYVAVNDDGESAPANVRLHVKGGPLPVAVAHVASIWAGKSVSIDLTEGATGGPFVGVDIEGVSDGKAGQVAVAAQGERFVLTFAPAAAFSGELVVRYALKNQFGWSAPGQVTITVKERPDPSREGEMAGLVASASEAAGRFSQVQASNAFRRMEGLHGGADPRANLGLGLPIDNGEGAPGQDRSREVMRAELEAATRPRSRKVESRRYNEPQGPGLGLWAGGAFDFGHRNASQTVARRKFETSGLTVGFDERFNSSLAAGLAVGFGRDRSEVGSAGARMTADQTSGMAYATMQMADKAFVDVVGGYGRLRYRTARPIAETSRTVEGRQKGTALFGAASLGMDFERRALGVTPYGRVQYLSARLGGYRETGDDTFALQVGSRTVEDLSVVAGTRAWVTRSMRSGVLRPQLRIEYRQTVKGAGSAALQYADWLDGPVYHVRSRAVETRSADIALGANWRGKDGASAEVEYQTDLLADGQVGRISVRLATPF